MKRLLIALSLMLSLTTTATAQKEKTQALINTYLRGYKFYVRAGYVIGGTAPLPLTKEIREIQSYKPGFRMSLEGDIHKQFDAHWGAMLGLRIEAKGMDTKALVKNYGMEMWYGNDLMVGYFTGTVKTKATTTLLTIPLTATYKISSRWSVKLGPYVSYAMNRDFSGSVYDGYLRVDDGKMNGTAPTGPTGQKVDIDASNPATYDFSSDMRKFQWGLELGGEWRALNYLNVFAHLDWGLNGAFKSDFDVINFTMYPIYATVGFAYAF